MANRFEFVHLILATRLALENTRRSPRRIALALLGVAIGIGSVTSMLLIGHGVAVQATKALEQLGGDVVTLGVAWGGTLPEASSSGDAIAQGPSAIARQNRAIERAAAYLRKQPVVRGVTPVAAPIGCGGESTETVFPADHTLASTLDLKLLSGRFLHPLDGAKAVAVVGSAAALSREQAGTRMTPGRQFEVCGKWFTIVGVLAPYVGDELLGSFRVDQAVIVSHAAADRLSSGYAPLMLLARTDGAENTGSELANAVQRHLGLTLQASGARELLRLRHEQTQLYTRFLAALGTVALVVGALGIANVMLAAVAERRRDTGIKVALGARPVDVMAEFLVESVLICLAGAAAGIALGCGGAALALASAGIEMAVNLSSLFTAAILAVIAGLAAGYYPAYRASRVDPLEALQGP